MNEKSTKVFKHFVNVGVDVGVNVFVGETEDVTNGVGENAGVHHLQSNRLPLSIEFKTFMGDEITFEPYITQTGFPSIIALNVESISNGIGSPTMYWIPLEQSVKTFENELEKLELNVKKDVFPVIKQFLRIDDVVWGVKLLNGKLTEYPVTDIDLELQILVGVIVVVNDGVYVAVTEGVWVSLGAHEKIDSKVNIEQESWVGVGDNVGQERFNRDESKSGHTLLLPDGPKTIGSPLTYSDKYHWVAPVL